MPVYSASFIAGRSRFDDPCGMRGVKSRRELLLESNLGPGHVPGSSLPTNRCRYSFPKAPRDSVDRCSTPGVGSYSIPRFYSDENYRVSRKQPQVVSAFLSSGRSKELGFDASFYRTIRDDVLASRRGPGLYESQSCFPMREVASKSLRQRLLANQEVDRNNSRSIACRSSA